MRYMLILVWLSCGAVDASEWKHLLSSGKTTILFDAESIVPSGKFRKGWFIFNYDDDQVGLAITGNKKYRSTKTLEYFVCDERVNATIQSLYYADTLGTGAYVGGYNVQPLKAEFTEVAPDTIGEAQWKLVCKKR